MGGNRTQERRVDTISSDSRGQRLIHPHNSTAVTRRNPSFNGTHPKLTERKANPANAARTRRKETCCAHGEPRANSTTAPKMYRKLSTKQNVPPKPLTILLGLSSLKFGYSTPRPTASPVKVTVITLTAMAK